MGRRGRGEYPLPITHYPLPITHYPLPVPHYPLPPYPQKMKYWRQDSILD